MRPPSSSSTSTTRFSVRTAREIANGTALGMQMIAPSQIIQVRGSARVEDLQRPDGDFRGGMTLLFRVPGGPVLAVLGILMCLAMFRQVDLSQSRILAVTVGAAMINWVWVRWRTRAA